MTIDQKGFDFLADQEGCRLTPYLDIAGHPTIGIGMTYYPDSGRPVTLKDAPITHVQALTYFHLMVEPRVRLVLALTGNKLKYSSQLTALVSFTYNEGDQALKESTLLKLIKENPFNPQIAAEFLKWDKIHRDGVVVTSQDLFERRTLEANLYFSEFTESDKEAGLV